MSDKNLSKLFVLHHLSHPETWREYEAAIIRLLESGKRRGGIMAVTDTIRWGKHQAVSNNFNPFYSRLFAATYPHLADFFEYHACPADFIDYDCLMAGDAVGALNWEDPQLELELA